MIYMKLSYCIANFIFRIKIMCCTGMSASTYQYGKLMSRERFLKTAQRKKNLNKNKGEPCSMRIEALLEATLIRIRSEWRRERDLAHDEEEEVEEPASKRANFDNYDIDDFEFDNGNDEEELESCFETCTMINTKEFSTTKTQQVQLWDDPEQVEDFFKKVTAHNPNVCDNSSCIADTLNNNINNNNKSINGDLLTTSTSENIGNSCNAIDFDDSFLDSVDEISSELTSFTPNYDVNSFTIDIDNIYKELFQNLINVDSYMKKTETTCT